MSPLVSEASRPDLAADAARRHPLRIGFRVLTAAAVSIALIGFGTPPGPARPARAGNDVGFSKDAPTSAQQPSREGFVREMRRTLKEADDRLIVLAKQVLEEPNSPGRLKDQIVNMRIMVKSAEANYQNAKLTREVAENAVKEYKEGVSVAEREQAEGEIRAAKRGLERARRETAEARERLARIKALTDNSAFGLNMEYAYTDRLTVAEFRETAEAGTVEVAESKKKVLLEYTYEKTVKELESELKKAHSDELAKQATCELEKAKLDKMQEALKAPWPVSNTGKRLLALLDRAAPIEEQVHSKLDIVARATQSNPMLQKEIRDLTNELGIIVEEAEAARAASDFARLKERIQQAARR